MYKDKNDDVLQEGQTIKITDGGFWVYRIITEDYYLTDLKGELTGDHLCNYKYNPVEKIEENVPQDYGFWHKDIW